MRAGRFPLACARASLLAQPGRIGGNSSLSSVQLQKKNQKLFFSTPSYLGVKLTIIKQDLKETAVLRATTCHHPPSSRLNGREPDGQTSSDTSGLDGKIQGHNHGAHCEVFATVSEAHPPDHHPLGGPFLARGSALEASGAPPDPRPVPGDPRAEKAVKMRIYRCFCTCGNAYVQPRTVWECGSGASGSSAIPPVPTFRRRRPPAGLCLTSPSPTTNF